MIKKIDHLVITTTNIEQTIKFYKTLGFVDNSTVERYQVYAGDFKINIHELGKELEPKAGYVKVGSTDICMEIEGDFEKYIKKLKSIDVEIELGIVDRIGAKGRMRSIYFRDPNKNLIELCKYE